MKQTFLALIIIAILTAVFAVPVFSQRFRATELEIRERRDLSYGGQNVGELFITVDGKTRKIADEASQAWIIGGGKEVVYSGADGSGGFENIGQSLRIYNVSTKKRRKIFSEYFSVSGLTEAKVSTGARVLLVRGYGGDTECIPFSVVDLARGEVFRHCSAELMKVSGDFITLAIDPEFPEGWFDDETNQTAFDLSVTKKYRKKRTYDLKKLIKRKVIYNRKTE
jgi:hypothetical protein